MPQRNGGARENDGDYVEYKSTPEIQLYIASTFCARFFVVSNTPVSYDYEGRTTSRPWRL